GSGSRQTSVRVRRHTEVWRLPLLLRFPHGFSGTGHTLTVRSSLALASVLPSGLKARHVTASTWPLRAATTRSLRTSHHLMVSSSPAPARSLPSGLKATQWTSYGFSPLIDRRS